MDREARHIATVALGEAAAHGTFFAPRAYEIASLDILHREVFGPILHVVRWKADQLDRVIDLNFYPIETARRGNLRWRPVGLGCMGLQDVFFKLRLPFDSAEARALSAKLAETIYFHALETSVDLAQERGRHPSFADTRAANGELQFDAWNITPEDAERWDALRARIREHGLRNSLLIAIAPTATIASIAGCYECIEPQVSNLFKRETLSGDFLVVNRYLVEELKALGLWTDAVRDEKLKVLRSLKPIRGEDVGHLSVRGQYRAGASSGAAVPLIAMAYDSSGPRAVLLVAVVFACGVVAGAVLFMLASARPKPHSAVAPAE